MKNPTLLLLLLFLFLTCHLSQVLSWKKDEFRNCNQTPFCKRARARTPASSALTAHHVALSDGDLTAKLIHQETNPLLLTLSAYQDGILRLRIDEDPNLDPKPRKRFEVPDVVLPEFETKKLWLQRLFTETIDGAAASIVFLSDGYEAVLKHDPFEVYVREAKGNRVISVNSNGLFDFEQTRERKEGEDWEEKFRGHTDKRPYGAQSISFDVSFYGADQVYGIPERATSFALKPTRGPGVEESEPYRLFNLDVFEYVHDSPFGLYGSIPFMISHGKAPRHFRILLVECCGNAD